MNRKHQRINSLNLLHYTCFDKNNQIVMQGMGRTLNVSQGGILLETHLPVSVENAILLDMGFEDETISINGKVVYNREGNNKRFEAGIEFKDVPENASIVLKKYIAAFHESKKNGPAD